MANQAPAAAGPVASNRHNIKAVVVGDGAVGTSTNDNADYPLTTHPLHYPVAAAAAGI